jgi:hypothetical protein
MNVAAIPLDRVTALPIAHGGRIVLRGVATTSVDGTSLDGIGLFDLASGGLQVVQALPERHEYLLTSTGELGSACAAAGVPSPCLVPRLRSLAHDRLRTEREFAATLSGPIEIEEMPPPSRPPTLAVAALFAVALVATALAVLRKRRRSPLGRVRNAARQALQSTLRDPTLRAVRSQILATLERAVKLDEARRVCARALRRVDRASLDRRRRTSERSPAPDAAEALVWLGEEYAELTRLENDLASSVAGLARIESGLRVAALRLRAHRGTRVRKESEDPMDLLAAEFALRDEAIAEVGQDP